MIIAANILVALVAILHIYFMVLEMFLWDKAFGLRTFGHTKDFAKATKILAKNQGLYNGFLAAGLIWGLSLDSTGTPITLFFLICIAIAGLYGGITANRKILLFQAMPAILALVVVYLT